MQVKLKFSRTATDDGIVITRNFNTKKQAREFVNTHDKDIVRAAIWTFDYTQWNLYKTLK